MKRKCLTCEHGYTPVDGWCRTGADTQSCDFGLKDGAAPVGEFCPMTGKKLQNASEKTIKTIRNYEENII